MDASQAMLDRVTSAREEAAKAERAYDFAAARIQTLSESTMDLFGDRTLSRVADIAAESRDATDTLYSAYQTLVAMVDAELRPLLSEGPSTRAVKEVLELIRFLNSESAISANFSGSLNGSSLGGLASVRYAPTIENRMVERFWEQTYAQMPGREEEDQAFRERQAEERRAKARAAREEREARRALEREERERERQENEKAEKRRQQSEAGMASELGRLRKAARFASRRVAVEHGGFGLTLVAIDAEGRTHVMSDRVAEDAQATARTWRNLEQVLTNHDTIYAVDAAGSVHVAGASTTHGETACAGWQNVKELALGDYVTLGLTQAGVVLATGESRRAHANSTVPGPFTWTNVTELFAGGTSDVIGRHADGSLVSVSYNYYVRSDEGPWVPTKPVESASRSVFGGVYLLGDGTVQTYGRMVAPKSLEGRPGIVQAVALGSHVVAVFHDGTVKVGTDRDNDAYANKIGRFLRSSDLDGRVLCIVGNADHAAFVTTDGEVWRYADRGRGQMASGKVEGLRLFSTMDELFDRMENPEKYRRLAREAEARLAAERRSQGVCPYCGGAFRKVLFVSVCGSCGRRKDY